jgi:hypothetical protein
MPSSQAYAALDTIRKVLQGLRATERAHVEFYLRGLLDAAVPKEEQFPTEIAAEEGTASAEANGPSRIVDIRRLREEKNPRSAVEMAVLVAYYLQNEAPTEERKDSIDNTDLERYFKQAGYRLPTRLGNILLRAKDAGYLDSTGPGRGRYRLNAVGYNLVAHNLPASVRTRMTSTSTTAGRKGQRTAKKARTRSSRKSGTRRK